MMQSIIDAVVQWATHLIGAWGLPAVFLLMLLESACIPVPSEAIMPFAGFAVSQGTMSLFGITVAGVAGNLAGSWIPSSTGTASTSCSATTMWSSPNAGSPATGRSPSSSAG
jgi:membrane protein DedA with SNARE-associated domain